MVYASTRPFDDPTLLLQLSWEPLVPHVTVNLYKEGFASDGITKTLTLVDTTETTSFDDWVQGFRRCRTAAMFRTSLPGAIHQRPLFLRFGWPAAVAGPLQRQWPENATAAVQIAVQVL